MSSARRPRTTYKEKTMLNLLYAFTPHPIMSQFTVLTRDSRDPLKFVDPFDL